MQIVVVIYLFDQSLISALLGLVEPFLRPMNIDYFDNKTFSCEIENDRRPIVLVTPYLGCIDAQPLKKFFSQ